MGHAGVGSGGLCRGGGLYRGSVRVMQGWGGSCRGGVCYVGVE